MSRDQPQNLSKANISDPHDKSNDMEMKKQKKYILKSSLSYIKAMLI
jgi:hypothetical protein